MNRKRTTGSTQPGGATISRPAIIASAFLGLHILPLIWRPNPLWGVDFLFYLPTPVQGLFVFLSALLFVPGVRRGIRACANALPLALWGRGRRVWLSRALVVLIALVGFVLLSTARHFLGDGYPVLENLEAGIWINSPRAPLSWALIRALHDVCQPYWKTAENTYRMYSYASGVLYVLLAFPVAGAIGKTGRDRSIVFAFLLTAGYIQLFFGYVEHYPLYMPGLLLYLFLGLQALKLRLTLFAPASVLGVLIALHTAFTVFAPSLVFLAYRAFRQRPDLIPSWKNALTKFAALCCVPVTAAFFVGLCDIGFEAYVSRMGGRNFLPLFSEPGYLSQYRIFSPAHVLDFLNQQLLAAPAVCMSLFLVDRKNFAIRPFLAVCAFLPLLFTFVANPEIGAFRDWDAFSLPALPLTLWTAAAFLESKNTGNSRFDTAFVICGAAALHTLAWVGVNSSASATHARFIHLTGRLTGSAGVNSWTVLGTFHEARKNDPAALRAYKRALRVDPTNPNRWLIVGNFLRTTGRHTIAIKYYERAVALIPADAIPYLKLGSVHSDLGQFDSAIEYTRKAIALDPNLAVAHINLSTIYRKTGKFDKAVQHLEKAAALRRNDAEIHEHLAEMYQDMGENEKAIRYLERASLLRPRHTRTLVNLALANSDAGKNKRAIELLKEAAALEPEFAAVHLNLGVIYIRIDQHATGIKSLSKANELKPEDPLTLQNIGFAYFDLGKHEKAVPYLQRAIQLDPGAADAHILLGMVYRALKHGDEARVHFEKILELEPGHPQAAQIREWLGQTPE